MLERALPLVEIFARGQHALVTDGRFCVSSTQKIGRLRLDLLGTIQVRRHDALFFLCCCCCCWRRLESIKNEEEWCFEWAWASFQHECGEFVSLFVCLSSSSSSSEFRPKKGTRRVSQQQQLRTRSLFVLVYKYALMKSYTGQATTTLGRALVVPIHI